MYPFFSNIRYLTTYNRKQTRDYNYNGVIEIAGFMTCDANKNSTFRSDHLLSHYSHSRLLLQENLL
jgi:hypothetical protein